MKSIAVVIAVAALSGCAVHHHDWVAPAVVGAAAGIVIHEAVKPQPQYHPRPPVVITPPPVVVQPLPPRPVYCHYQPWYDAWGYYRGDRRVCY